ncbi:HYC_CC_PP family protein [Mucilaginibacter sp.]
MMKRAAILLIALLYLGTVMGVGLNFHYCFGRVSSVKLYESQPDCKLLKRTKKPGCCQSKQLNVKVKDSHEQVKEGVKLYSPVAQRPATHYAGLQLAVSGINISGYTYRGPPLTALSCCPLFIKNCTFRI